MFKCTEYFLYTRNRPDRAAMKEDWIGAAIRCPCASVRQHDGRIRLWVWIEEEQKYLRIILLEDGETVHNAFFDRDFREGADKA